MSSRTFPHRLLGLAACAAVCIGTLAEPAWAGDSPRPAAAASAASAPKHINNTPLRFEPPAAGPHGPTRADYEYCIEHPSLDGLHTDCSALLPDIPPKPAAAAKPAKPR